ncbi:MAG: hypothetical protein HY332_21170 [Chloroflexi bacterium]|nr:hypothetical protein [Chloroflexota bacterium]
MPAAAAVAAVQPLTVTPAQGTVGTPFTVSAEGLPAGKTVEFQWTTVSGSYEMKPSAETIEFYERAFSEQRVPLGQARIDNAGRVSATFTIPEDYGEVHTIAALVDGEEAARGGLSMVRHVTASPLSGPVGTPITIDVTGLGWTPFANTMGVLYDNKYTGFLSAVTTRGTARAQIRASGTVGEHVIRVTDASAATPYLNTEQSPRKLPQFEFTFAVTEDAGPPPLTLDWPEDGRAASEAVKTTARPRPVVPGLSLWLSPAAGPINTRTTLGGTGLPASATLDLYWMTVKGNRVSPSGWNLVEWPLGAATTDAGGSLTKEIDIPDDLGGWHVVKVAQGERILAETPYFLERSLVTVTPAEVRAGEKFQVQVKGIGWTELDNGFAATYDNAYIGYACGFNSQGDVTINLHATGGPGTHLIDLYPMIFLGHGKGPWNYDIPQLSWAQDHPSLELGYRLPAFRLAVTVVE